MTDEPKLLAQQPHKIAAYSAGAGVSVILLTLAAWGATRPSDDTELAQWFPAIAGAATTIAAVVAAIFAAGAFRLEYRREIRLLDDAERAQAESFVGWATVGGGIGRSGGYDETVGYQVGGPYLMLRNASPLPIFDVSVLMQYRSDEPGINEFELPAVDVDLVPPGATSEHSMALTNFVVPKPPGFNGLTPLPRVSVRVATQFRDSGNRYWRRHGDGTIEKGKGDLRL